MRATVFALVVLLVVLASADCWAAQPSNRRENVMIPETALTEEATEVLVQKVRDLAKGISRSEVAKRLGEPPFLQVDAGKKGEPLGSRARYFIEHGAGPPSRHKDRYIELGFDSRSRLTRVLYVLHHDGPIARIVQALIYGGVGRIELDRGWNAETGNSISHYTFDTSHVPGYADLAAAIGVLTPSRNRYLARQPVSRLRLFDNGGSEIGNISLPAAGDDGVVDAELSVRRVAELRNWLDQAALKGRANR